MERGIPRPIVTEWGPQEVVPVYHFAENPSPAFSVEIRLVPDKVIRFNEEQIRQNSDLILKLYEEMCIYRPDISPILGDEWTDKQREYFRFRLIHNNNSIYLLSLYFERHEKDKSEYGTNQPIISAINMSVNVDELQRVSNIRDSILGIIPEAINIIVATMYSLIENGFIVDIARNDDGAMTRIPLIIHHFSVKTHANRDQLLKSFRDFFRTLFDRSILSEMTSDELGSEFQNRIWLNL